MINQKIFLGQTPLNQEHKDVDGGFVLIGDEKYYKIGQYHHMPDFFMTIVSVADHWMFISSNGALTAGRKDRDNALFPYYCVDKIHDQYDISGSKTLALVSKGDKTFLWEPFSKKTEGVYSIERNLYKNIYGNKLIFEEINHELGVAFQYGWFFSQKYGFIKKSAITNLTAENLAVNILDGIQNILPSGTHYSFQMEYSNLLDAYKRNELVAGAPMGLFTLSSVPVDRAEPSESLKVTTVWTSGLENPLFLISNNQVGNFRKGLPLQNEADVKATRGAFFVNKPLTLAPKSTSEWILVAEINQDANQVAEMVDHIKTENDLIEKVFAQVASDTLKLKAIVAKADGFQMSNDQTTYARHYTNTLFNVMRGGIFINHYNIDLTDFSDFISKANKQVHANYKQWLNELPNQMDCHELIKKAEQFENDDLMRLSYEYLPITFSRRHGDPSRPWNRFSIEIQNNGTTVKSDYQGNWRDIFQNWEALAFTYPGFVEQMMVKFLNASTADGYNPYRVTRDGIDWERPDPHDPWAFIGYWGDHQIIYLQKLLEISTHFNPGKISQLLDKEMFVYANVPYRIKSYEQMVSNPQDTIVFDYGLDKEISKLASQLGSDGKLVFGSHNQVYKVTLIEKMMVSWLAKLGSFIPEAGIWLNTQRPEWNDANNALVGNGASMVTLYYLRRSLKFWIQLLKDQPANEFRISEEVKLWFERTFSQFQKYSSLLHEGFTGKDRRIFADAVGKAGSQYRANFYEHSFSGKKKTLGTSSLIQFAELSLQYIDQSIRANKRVDGLYHAYNLVAFTRDGISISYLYEMLEGQVSVLSSGYLSATESLQVLDALKASRMFRTDQSSYMLYPDRALPLFAQKNNIPAGEVKKSALLNRLLQLNDTSIIQKDIHGNYHFNGSFRNSKHLHEALERLDKAKFKAMVEEERPLIETIYESVFDHRSFTGRSGTFYGFEGLGSIYWHMVSKLLLVASESYYQAIMEGADAKVLGRLKDHFYEIKAGIGLYKSPKLYGAFPTDAYSHTPKHAGAQQPGMTGQVKEDILSRFGELGVIVKEGQISFNASLIKLDEFLKKPGEFEYFTSEGQPATLKLHEAQLAFTFCGVPFIYSLQNNETIDVELKTGQTLHVEGHQLNEEWSRKIFSRNGEVIKVNIGLVKH
jgi:hypothetical protein